MHSQHFLLTQAYPTLYITCLAPVGIGVPGFYLRAPYCVLCLSQLLKQKDIWV